ncbi:Gfo/Idh/MocA family protein [Nakamurella aerolata]|uniref:Gfo/Idh/MocA family protein n=1 Tax=Nakamurella aerolata TaxID=1656892 RepID=UPI001BB25494
MSRIVGSDRTGPVGVGLIGAGNISAQYLTNLVRLPDVRVVIVGDLATEVAAARAAEFGIPEHGDAAAVLAHPDVEIVVNLTIPAAHVAVSQQAVAAGKHVWTEKPLGTELGAAAELLEQAAAAGVLVGCAPDTLLGSGFRASRNLVEDGSVGTVTSAVTMMQGPGPESWHPSPEFLFARGGGPVLDIGPYYFTALVQLFGPVRRVMALGSTAFATRTIGSGPKAGQQFPVEVPTAVSALLQFADGGFATTVFSFESPQSRHGFVEITGTDATLVVPDPNAHVGASTVVIADGEPREVDAATANAGGDVGRGVGVVDLARAIRTGSPQHASGELGLHVLDIMLSIEQAVASAEPVTLTTTTSRPPALPTEWNPAASTL